MDGIARGRSNVAPAKLPWDLLRILIIETYGGKIDDAEDFQQLEVIVNQCMTPAAYEDGHQLVAGAPDEEAEAYSDGNGGLATPEGTTMADFKRWVDRLPEREPPRYLGLPANAEKLVLVGHGKEIIGNVARLSSILDEGEQLAGEEERGV